MEQEILTMYKQIYGDFHPRVTEVMIIMAKNLMCLLKNGCMPVDLLTFITDTCNHLKVTHGASNAMCKLFLEAVVGESAGAVALPITEELAKQFNNI